MEEKKAYVLEEATTAAHEIMQKSVPVVDVVGLIECIHSRVTALEVSNQSLKDVDHTRYIQNINKINDRLDALEKEEEQASEGRGDLDNRVTVLEESAYINKHHRELHENILNRLSTLEEKLEKGFDAINHGLK